MDPRRSLFLIAAATLLLWAAFALVLFQIDPFTSGVVGQLSFFAPLSLALLGTCTLIGVLLRRVFRHGQVAYQLISTSLRQGLFLTIVVVGALLLMSAKLFTWWSMGFLVAAFAVLEFFFLTRSSTSSA